MTSSTLICLMAKALPTQACLWHRRLSYLNFNNINLLSKKDTVIGLPKGTKFLNKTLHAFFKEEGIEHQSSTPQTPEQNGIVERRNHSLVEAGHTTALSQQELDDKIFNACTLSFNKSSSPTDNSKQQDTPPTMNIQSSTEPTTPTNVNAKENNDNQAVDTQF
ncbi:retrovirus-related pol polyprotein from transposon TNT 1-94 [Tanacetum coccineum]